MDEMAQPWGRVHQELRDLDDKIIELTAFIETMDDTNRVEYKHWQLLEAQLHAMRAYAQILRIRISTF